MTEEQRAVWQARQQQAKKSVTLMLSVTVLHSESYSGKVRTQFRWWSKDQTQEFEAVSKVDGNWLSGFANFETNEVRYSLLMGIGNQDLDRWSARLASLGRTFTPPSLPDLPEGGPDFVVTKGNPSAEELASITAIHALVKTDGEKLRLAYEGREQARKQQEAFLKANPPKPRDIVLNYWRIPKPAAPVNVPQGGPHE